MTKKFDRAIRKLIKLEDNVARHRYSYFVINEDGGFRWYLTDRTGNDLCMSTVFSSKAYCLKSLRAPQNHATTTDVRDDTR